MGDHLPLEMKGTNETTKAWDAIATGYDAHVTETHLNLAEAALDRVGLRPGDRFLDVAAGSGALALPAARRGARVLAIDLSETMLRRLQTRAREETIDVTTRAMDGHHLELPDDSFDVAGSQFGLMLFPDLPRGLAEMVRVTRPGGKVLVNVYGAPQKVEFLGFFLGAMRQVVPDFVGLPLDPLPLPFQVSDPDRLRGALERAGLGDVRVETTTETLRFEDGQGLWDWVVNSNPIARGFIADLTDDQAVEVRKVLDAMVRERRGDAATAEITNPVHIAIGTV